jgi:CRP/FNR family transcriptional regulator
LNRIKFYKTYPAGQTIASDGENLEIVASVVSGTATLSRTMEDGRTQILGLLLPSDFMGRPGRKTVAYDITALTDVTLCCFFRKPFEALLQKTPHLSERLIEMALDELDAARDWMLLLGRKSAREKIASMIMFVLRRSCKSGEVAAESVHINLPIAREEMANYLGLTIETVSRQLTALKTEGLIELEGKRGIIVPDITALAKETGDDLG